MQPSDPSVRTNLLYVHGFNSSPLSLKAQLTKEYFAKHHPEVKFHCPQLATSPNKIVQQLNALIDSPSETPKITSLEHEHKQTDNTEQRWLLVGSSLGGYFSTYLAQKYQLRAVLINPAVKPYLLMNDYLGVQSNPYTGQAFSVEASHIGDLKLLEQNELCKNNYLVMLQTGDEVLNYRQAEKKYQQCRLIVQQGGDHSFIGYQHMLPKLAEFFQLT
jgi:predicted esterase YcpF (UPF0227 family)